MANLTQYPPTSASRPMWQGPASPQEGSLTDAPAAPQTEPDMAQPMLRLSPQEGLGAGLYGSMQEALADNLGLYAVCEFVVGTQSMETKEGILYSVGRSFLVLYDERQQNFVLCDVFSIKFVTLYMPGHRPWNLTRIPPVPMVEVPGVGSVPAGPFGIGTGSTPHLQNSPLRGNVLTGE